MAREDEHIRIGYTIWPSGAFPLAWRLSGAWANPFSYKTFKETAHVAERGLLDFYFIGDQYAGDPSSQYRQLNHVSRPEAFTTAAFIAGLTEHLGIIVTSNTTYSDPYSTARKTAQLDILSNGRALWNIVTGLNPRPAANFGRPEHWDNARRYDWTEEFVKVVSLLWDSWDADAVVADPASGLLVDPDKVRAINFKGDFFNVAGPLNVGPPPQGQVPIVTAGTSERSRELGARFADARFFNVLTAEYYADVKRRLAKYGRTPESHVMLAAVTFLVGTTEREAREKLRQIDEAADVDFDPRIVAQDLNLGVDSLPLDVPLSKLDEFAEGGALHAKPIDLAEQNIFRERVLNEAQAEGPADLESVINEARAALGEEDITLRDVYRRFVQRFPSGTRVNFVTGDAAQVADWIEEKFDSYILDGIISFVPYLPGAFHDFVDLVIPELQRRGRFRTEYKSDTIRERWGLDRPANQFRGKNLIAPRGELARTSDG
jgi:FMN-dependent oxidoreductase (nitrilotriacetate monooxygenase family)